MFFDPRKYDFSRVGRLKFNIKLYENQDATHLDHRTLTAEDFYATIRYLLSCARTSAWWTILSITWATAAYARWGELMEEPVPHRAGAHGARHQEKMSVYQELNTAMPA